LHGEKLAGIKTKQKVAVGFPRVGCRNYFYESPHQQVATWSSCHPNTTKNYKHCNDINGFLTCLHSPLGKQLKRQIKRNEEKH
jgi:hypothetical protein